MSKKTIFVIEASSYQIDYSKIFKTNYAMILNITPDHLERHGTFANYIKAKFKLIRTQTNKDYSFLNENNKFLKKESKKHFPATGIASLCGVIVEASEETGLANNIEYFVHGGVLKYSD